MMLVDYVYTVIHNNRLLFAKHSLVDYEHLISWVVV